MRPFFRHVPFFAALLLPAAALADQSCDATGDWQTAEFSGEAYGENVLGVEAGPNVLILSPTDYGWRIEMVDSDGLGVAVFAAPIRPVETNPLNIAGWHFRNADNSGPNRGEVNAPQTIRKFTFGALAADPTANPELVAPGAPGATASGGIGELIIENYGLADLEPGQRARMVYLKFSGCVGWDPGPQEATLASTAAPGIGYEEVVETMQACGLPADVFRLSDRMAQGSERGSEPFLQPDLDGDGVADLVAPVERLGDSAPGLAMCLRGGDTLVLAGYDGRIGEHLDPVYFGRVDWWGVHDGPIGQGVAEGPPPEPKGQAVLIGKDDSSSALVFLNADGAVDSYWQGD